MIGTQVPSAWVQKQDYIFAGPIQVGDLVVIQVSDGTRRFAEVCRQSGPDMWDLLVTVTPQQTIHQGIGGASLGRVQNASMSAVRDQHFYELQHPDLIDTPMPATWIQQQDFRFSGPLQVGDLVLVQRSDGSMKFAEVMKHNGADLWDLIVKIAPQQQLYRNCHGATLGRPDAQSLAILENHKSVFNTWNTMEQEHEGILLQQTATINRAKEFLRDTHPEVASRSQSWVARAGFAGVSKNPEDWGQEFTVEASYTGPHVKWPLKLENVREVVHHIRAHPDYPLHPKYIAQIVGTGMQMFETLPTSVAEMSVPTGPDGRLVVLGDTHGQLHDLLWVLELHGEPSPSCAYLLNGDMADRGKYAVEIIIIVLMYKILYPENVIMNRGNHEALDLNRVYGFGAEVSEKHHPNLNMMFQNLFKELPVATVVDSKVFVVHGGLPRDPRVELKDIRKVERKVLELARPTCLDTGIMWDLLWADPMEHHLGVMMNPNRGEDVVFFGADITHHFLSQNALSLCIRSHQVPTTNRGFEYCHGGRLLTLFTASNYCGCTNNTGAVAILRSNLSIELKEHMAPPLEQIAQMTMEADARQEALLAQDKARLLSLEDSAAKMREEVLTKIEAKVLSKKSDLWLYWATQAAGQATIPLAVWREGMTNKLQLQIDWSTLEDGLVEVDAGGNVDYMRFLDKYQPQDEHGIPLKEGWEAKMVHKVYEQVLRCDWTPEELMQHFDPDGDGLVTLMEFKDGLAAAGLSLPEWQIDTLLRTIERDELGKLSLSAFLDRFQVVYSTSSDKDLLSDVSLETKALLSDVGRRLIGEKSRMEVFQAMDADHNGFIDEQEFFTALETLDFSELSAEQKGNLWRLVDITQDGRVNYLEFCAAFEIVDTSDGGKQAQKEMVASILAVLNENKAALAYALSFFDTKLEGKVTKEEFKSALRALNASIERPEGAADPFTEDQLEVVAESLQADQDGLTDVSHLFSAMSVQC